MQRFCVHHISHVKNKVQLGLINAVWEMVTLRLLKVVHDVRFSQKEQKDWHFAFDSEGPRSCVWLCNRLGFKQMNIW